MSRIQILKLSCETSLSEISRDRQSSIMGGRYDYTDPARLDALLKAYREGIYDLKIELNGDYGDRLIFNPVDRDNAPLGIFETWPI